MEIFSFLKASLEQFNCRETRHKSPFRTLRDMYKDPLRLSDL